MAGWTDYISLTVTLAFIAAVIYGILYLNQQFRKAVDTTKSKLHNKGIDVSATGASVRTRSKLSNREEYFDATQRKFVRALAKGSVGHDSVTAPQLARSNTSGSVKSYK